MASWENYTCRDCGRDLRSKSTSKKHRCKCGSYNTVLKAGAVSAVTQPVKAGSGVSLTPQAVSPGGVSSGDFASKEKALIMELYQAEADCLELMNRSFDMGLPEAEHESICMELLKRKNDALLCEGRLKAFRGIVDAYSSNARLSRLEREVSERLARLES